MLLEFDPLNTVDIDAFVRFNNELKSILESIDNETIFSENNYTQEEFSELLQSFIAKQRQSLGRTNPGSWSIVPNDDNMPSDARVEFIFQPTYLVTAILSRVKVDFPEIASPIIRYDFALKKGMHFCSYRKLSGHGYEVDQGAAEALTILSMGKVPLLLEKDKNYCPELRKAIKDVVERMKYRLITNTAKGAWGEDLQGIFRSALEMYHIKNDEEMQEIIFIK